MSLIPTTSLIRDSSDSNPAFMLGVREVSDYYLACFHKFGGIYTFRPLCKMKCVNMLVT